MQRLPRLVIEKIAWRLPLTDPTASAILALVSTESADSESRLEQALIADPVLTTWFALRARQFDNVTFGCLRDLATWLNPVRLFRQLEWADLSDAAPLRASPASLESWRQVADSSSRLLCVRPDAASDRAFYLRSLSCGAKWFGTCCQRSTDLQDGQRLDRVIGRFQEMGASVLPSDIRADGPTQNGVVHHQVGVGDWSNTQLVAPLLPGLMTQLRRLAALEQDFDRCLEDQKLRAMKELAYGASHEINNPLANISARAQTLLVDERDPDRRRKLAAINRQAFRAHDMIADMMLFAKPPKMNLQLVQVATVIHEVIDGLRDRLMECRIRIDPQIAGTLPEIEADATQLRVAFRAILQNAIQAIQEDGTITVSAETQGGMSTCRAVTIRVQDTGPGIPEETRLHIFDPFFSGREAGRGLGFGLSKAWRIVHEHGGRLEVESVPGCGTVFTMRVPSQTAS